MSKASSLRPTRKPRWFWKVSALKAAGGTPAYENAGGCKHPPDFHFTGCVDCIDACAASLRPLPLDDHHQMLGTRICVQMRIAAKPRREGERLKHACMFS